MNDFSRKFGIELEITRISKGECLRAIRAAGVAVDIEGYNHIDYADHWKIVNDGSVQDGFELVSPILDGQAGLDEALRVSAAISTAGASANKTCGFHVHFDAWSMNVAEIRMICKRYAAFEEKIDSFMPESRRGNNNQYCKSVVHEFSKSAYNAARTPAELADAQYDRYFKVNLRAYLRHHTIEFRQHSGTADPEKIKNWVLFLNDFINESIRLASLPGCQSETHQKHWQNLIDLISGNDGMLASEIIGRLGIQPHSLRGQISHMRAAGIAITTTRTPAGSIYKYCKEDAQDALFNGVDTETKEFYMRRAAQMAA